jgi:PAS domain S-box-containing protein
MPGSSRPRYVYLPKLSGAGHNLYPNPPVGAAVVAALPGQGAAMIPEHSPLKRYGLALGLTLLAFLGHQGLNRLVEGQLPAFITFYPCVMIVALLAGAGPGMLATATAALLVGYWIMPPVGFVLDSLLNAFSLAVFICLGSLICLATELYRRTCRPGSWDPGLEGFRRQGAGAFPRARRLLIGAGMLGSLAIILAVFLHVQGHLKAAGDIDLLIAQSRTVSGNLDQLLSALKDAEAGQRGYLLTGSPAHLEPFHAAERAVGPLLDAFSQEAARDGSQKLQLNRLAALTREHLADLKLSLALRQDNDFPTHARLVTVRSNAALDEIRQVVADLQAVEQRKLREHHERRASQRLLAGQAVQQGGLLSLLLLGTVFTFLMHENRLRAKAEVGLLGYQAHLQDLVASRTEQLEQANRELEQEAVGHRQAREALSRSHDALEQRVAERTAELELRNSQLVCEAAERREVEAALQQSEQRYRAVVEDQTDIIARYLPDGRYTFVNEAFCRFFAKSFDEVVGREWYPDVFAEDIPALVDQLQLLSPDNPLVEVEYRLTSGTGEIHWVQFVNRGFFDPQGRLLETQAVGRDITRRKQLEETLRVSESKFRIIFENEIYGILIYDFESGEILDVNQTVVSMYGYSREELCSGMSAYAFSVKPGTSKEASRGVSRSKTTFFPLRLHRKKDGTVFPVEAVAGAYLWNGREVMFSLIHDITERRKTEETLERYSRRLVVVEEDLRKRIAMELHDDIGQVLTGLSFNLAHIQAHLPEQGDPRLRSTLDDSRALTKEISRKVRDLMVDLRPTQLDEYGLSAAVRHHAEQYAQRTGIAVAVQVDPSLPRLAVKKELALFRITQEALNNVAKHAAATQVSVSLMAGASSVRLAISDDGKGFLPRPATPQPTGTGWGLTIMRERAELAGGRFQIDTVPGAGTTISVEVSEGGAYGG